MSKGTASASRSCQICGSTHKQLLKPAALVRPAISDLVRKETGRWDEAGWICLEDLQRFRQRYVESLLRDEKGELSDIDRQVVRSLREQELLSRNPEEEFRRNLTPGQRAADGIAQFGGSWGFLGLFALVLVGWIATNSLLLVVRPFDPYPFILLNLLLSCLAAVQAPIIMMSQNRQEARDRERGFHDYQVDLKAELEIRQLHQKLDHLLSHQWERLFEIQQIQMELIEEVRRVAR